MSRPEARGSFQFRCSIFRTLCRPLKASLQVLALSAAALLLASCRAVHFYTQAARGQWEIIHGAKSISSVLCDAATPAAVCAKLKLVQELRSFAARELLLPADSQYDRYCDLHRQYVVWVVFAAPEFSVEAKTWGYPVVGSLKYRGFLTFRPGKKTGRCSGRSRSWTRFTRDRPRGEWF